MDGVYVMFQMPLNGNMGALSLGLTSLEVSMPQRGTNSNRPWQTRLWVRAAMGS